MAVNKQAAATTGYYKKDAKGNKVFVPTTPQEQQQAQNQGDQFISNINAEQNRGLTTQSAREAALNDTAAQQQDAYLATPEGAIKNKLEMQAAEANVTQALLQQEVAKQNAAAQLKNTSTADTIKTIDKTTQSAQPFIQPQGTAPLQSGQASMTSLGQITGTTPQLIGDAQNTFDTGVSTIAKVIDMFRAGFSAGKTTPVKQAEAGFLDARNVLQTDINMVKLGQKDYVDAYNDFQQMQDAISALESEQKGLGQINLRYLLDNGAEIQQQILREKRNLEQYKILLVQARDAAQLNQAKQKYGLTPDTSSVNFPTDTAVTQ